MATTAAPPPGHACRARARARARPRACRRVDQPLGEQRIGAARLVGADGAGQHAHADQELLLAADDAGAVEHLLEVVPRSPSSAAIERVELRRGRAALPKQARIEHRIEQRGGAVLRMRASRGAVPMMSASSSQQARVLRAAARTAARRPAARTRKRSKPTKARSGSAVSASASISSGCTSVSSSRARGDAHGRIAAVMPAAHQRRCTSGALRVAHLGRAPRRSPGSSASPANTMLAPPRVSSGLSSNRRSVVVLHASPARPSARARTLRCRRKPQKRAKRRASLPASSGSVWVCSSATICRRCSMRAQEAVGLAQLVATLRLDPAALRERAERVERRRRRAAPAGGRRRSAAGSGRRTRSRGCRRGRA